MNKKEMLERLNSLDQYVNTIDKTVNKFRTFNAHLIDEHKALYSRLKKVEDNIIDINNTLIQLSCTHPETHIDNNNFQVCSVCGSVIRKLSEEERCIEEIKSGVEMIKKAKDFYKKVTGEDLDMEDIEV
jgi:uncharacterized protein with PIN domain